MSFHGTSGWGADLATRNSVALDATTYEAGEHFEVMVAKKRNGLNRYLEFTLPEGQEGYTFLLTRDGIEDLNLFINE